MMDIQLVQPIFDAIDNGLKGTLATGTTQLMAVLGTILGTCWLIQLTMKGIYWLFNGLDTAFQEILITIGKASFIIFFSFNVSWYITTIVPIVNETPAGITQILTQSPSAATNQVDTLVNTFINTVIKVVKSLDFSFFSDFNVFASGVAVFVLLILGGFAFLGTCITTLLILKIATTIFLVLGPLFFIFALFENTRQWFWGWVSLIAGFMLTNILFGVVISLEINYITENTLNDQGLFESDWVSILSMPLVFGAFAAVATMLPNYAASVVGGAPIGDAGTLRGMMKLGAPGGVMASRLMAKGISKGTSKAWTAMRNRNRLR